MRLLITVLMMGILTGAEVDLFVPSFPDIQNTFALSTFMVELLLGINLTAHCITALVVGNLGDRYGRKPIVILGLIIFTIGSVACVLATHYYVLLIGRLLQGVGISGAAVLGYLVLSDVYSTEVQQRMMGSLNGAVTLAMAFAPVVGSYINLFFNWRGNFVLLLILGIVCLILTTLYLPHGKKNYNVTISLKEYAPIFKSTKAIYYLITIVFLIQPYWIFIGMSPILYMQDLGVPLQDFGLYQGAMAGVFAVMSFASGYLLTKFGQRKCFFFSISSLIAFIFAAIILIIYNTTSPLIITLVTQLLSIGVLFPINILWPLFLEALPEAKARMAAILTSGRWVVTAANLQLVSLVYHGTFRPVGIAMSITLIIALFACYKLFQEDKVFN